MTLKQPVPQPSSDIRTWANKLTKYLYSLEAVISTPSPKIVQLENLPKLANIPATMDGVLVFSKEEGGVLVSYNNHWYKLDMTLIA